MKQDMVLEVLTLSVGFLGAVELCCEWNLPLVAILGILPLTLASAVLVKEMFVSFANILEGR